MTDAADGAVNGHAGQRCPQGGTAPPQPVNVSGDDPAGLDAQAATTAAQHPPVLLAEAIAHDVDEGVDA